MGYTIERDGDVLLLVVDGTWTPEVAFQLQEEAAKEIKRHGLRGLLVDLRRAEHGKVSTIDIYEVTVSHETVFPSSTRHAVLYDPKRFSRSDAVFYENVAANRGLKAAVFTDRDEAIVWLRSEKKPPSS